MYKFIDQQDLVAVLVASYYPLLCPLGHPGGLGGLAQALERGRDLRLALVRPSLVLHDGHGRTAARAVPAWESLCACF